MTLNLDAPTSLSTVKKTPMTMVIAGVLTGCIFAISSANAAPKIIVNQPVTASSTVVAQSSDGKVATITTTPNGISMQNGVPFSVTQITNVPRYTVHQGAVNQSSLNPATTTVATLPLNTIPVTNQVTPVGIVTTPVNTVTQVLPITTNTVAINNQVAGAVTSTITLDSLQLKPTFSTSGLANAQTKVMKILKDASGKEFAVPANHVAPGDVIEYHTTYTNTSAQPVNQLNATVALPNGVKLVSLNSPLPTLATTGGDNYQTIQQMGNSVMIQEDYSGLQWNLVNLAANAPQTVVIRAKVQ